MQKINPTRLQRLRKKGFNLQELSLAKNGLQCVSVTRPGQWGNIFKVGGRYKWGGLTKTGIDSLMIVMEAYVPDDRFTTLKTPEQCIEWYEKYIQLKPGFIDKIKKELRGKNLACWCEIGAACHADSLLKISNP